jgi:hypothetical protein
MIFHGHEKKRAAKTIYNNEASFLEWFEALTADKKAGNEQGRGKGI